MYTTKNAHALAIDLPDAATANAYIKYRVPDRVVGRQLIRAVGSVTTIVNVGSGTGSYERWLPVTASVEPSVAMRAHRPPDLVPVIAAHAEDIPLQDKSFECAMALMTIHQWHDLEMGIAELARVAQRAVVIMTIDPKNSYSWWLDDYMPEVSELERMRNPDLECISDMLGVDARVDKMTIPKCCSDLFVEACSDRPELLLDEAVRRAQSVWRLISSERQQQFVDLLAMDLRSGEWDRKYGSWRHAKSTKCSMVVAQWCLS